MKELFPVNPSNNISKKRVIKLATMVKMCCYKCFTRNLVKIYRTAILTNFFWCMQSKSQWSTHPVVFFNPLMLVVTKDTHIYLNKPGSLSWRFACGYCAHAVGTLEETDGLLKELIKSIKLVIHKICKFKTF